MFFDPECIPCMINQAFNSAKLFTDGNKDIQLKILKEVCADIQNIDGNYSAPLFSKNIDSIIKKYYSSKDLYEKIKEENITKARSYLLYLQTMIDNSTDKLEMALRASIIGNTIDLGVNPNYDIEYEINRITSDKIDISALEQFKADLEKAKLILYIGDNYEEALFDKFLLNQLNNKEVVFAVRSKPILNDITLEDARQLGIDKICTVIESGSTIAGTDLSECTPQFLNLFNSADLVISKGQGNYETLLNQERPIYFLFKVKCMAISRRCGYPIGNGIMLFNSGN